MTLEVVAVAAADEAVGAHVLLRQPLEVAQLGERVHDDAKDDVERDGCEENEETDLVDRQVAEVLKCVHHWVQSKNLQKESGNPSRTPQTLKKVLLFNKTSSGTDCITTTMRGGRHCQKRGETLLFHLHLLADDFEF